MAEPLEIVEAAAHLLAGTTDKPLAGKRVLITSGPTHEPIDPIRYIANRSSGKQGHAIAAAAAAAGAEVILVSGPVHVPDPAGVKPVRVTTAREMLEAVRRGLPADVAIFAAAVADWGVAAPEAQKIKKIEIRCAVLRADREPGHPRDRGEAQDRTAQARGRLRGGNRKGDRSRKGQAEEQGLRLDRRQRCVAGLRRHGRRPQHRASRDAQAAWNHGPRNPRTRSPATWSAASPSALNGPDR